MNSPFATIFLAIQAQVTANMPAIAHIDQDLGQLKNARPPVAWPCVLIDFEDFSYGNLSENVQTATGTVVIRLGFAPYGSTSQVAPTIYATQALGYYDLEWSLHKLLQGWHPGDSFGALCRESATTQERSDHYRVREIRYSIGFEDYSAKPLQTYAMATLLVGEEMGVL